MEKQNFYDLSFEQLKAFLINNAAVDSKKAKMIPTTFQCSLQKKY
jgi:hypothetical protein